MSLRVFLVRFFSRRHRRSDADLDDEFSAHIEMAAAEFRARGMSEEAAGREARMRFGGVTQQREAYRQQSRPPWIDSIGADLRYAARQLRRNPGFATIAILTLGLGIGATTAIYSLVQAVLLRSLPYGHADRLVYLYTPIATFHLPVEMFTLSNADFFDIRRLNHSFASMTLFGQETDNLATSDSVQRVESATVDANFFSTLEVAATLGRVITAEDNQLGHQHVAVISHALWKSLFAERPDVLGYSISLNGNSYRIVGVMPPDFTYPSPNELPYGNGSDKTDVWMPLALTPQQAAERDNDSLNTIARLKPGVSRGAALSEMSAIMRRLDTLHSAEMRGWGAAIRGFRDSIVGPVRSLLWLLFGAVCCVLLVACGNAANLLMARAAARSHEFGVRATLGAGRLRMTRQMLTESLLLAAIAGIAGIFLAWLFLRLLLRLDPGNIPRLQQASLNPWVLLFSAAITLVACIFFGTVPAIATSRVSPNALLRTGIGRGVVSTSNRGRNLLIVGEVGLVVLLLAGAGLLLRSYQRVLAESSGFIPSTVTFQVQLDSRYARPEDRLSYFRRLLDRIAAIPGVRATGADYFLPLSNTGSLSTLWVEGSPSNVKGQLAAGDNVTPQFLTAMGTPLIRGRFFTEADGPSSNIIIVNQSFAHHYFPGRDALGGHVRGGDESKAPWQTIVGIVGDVRSASMETAPEPEIYRPLWHDNPAARSDAFIAVRSFLPPDTLIPSLRAAVRSVDATIAPSEIQTMQQAVATSTSRRRFQTTLLTIFAVTSLVLALIGLYGLLAYSVRQRVAEIGVRIALGASRPRVISMVVRQGLRLVVIGLALGLAASFVSVRFLAGVLYGVSPYDPWTFVAAPALVLLAALIACSAPAWRAAHIEPVEALRSE
jgi:putative ABC transport system permease protein